MLSERLLSIATSGAEWVLWLLIALSLLSLAVLVDRALLIFRTRERVGELGPRLSKALASGDFAAARSAVGSDSLVRNVVRAGLEAAEKRPGKDSVEQAMLGALARERARYEARLPVLGTIGNNAPFIGLFGTVLGIIQAFAELSKAGATQAAASQVVIGAIGEALVATAVGILVAIPAVAAFNWARSNLAARVKHAESMTRALLQSVSAEQSTQA